MVDPVTIGTLAASALAMAGEEVLKDAVGEAVKDAYRALKDKIASWTNDDVEAFENAPTSATRQAEVAKIVDNQSDDDKAAVRRFVEQLISALKQASSGKVALDVGRLEALEVQLGNITVTEGTGARFGDVRADTFRTGDLTVGDQLRKKRCRQRIHTRPLPR
jgi:hypothetical protein